MIKQTGFATVLVAACAQAGSIKVGLISDLHLNLAYDQLASEDDNCVSGGSGSSESQTAPIGRINCDPSTTLVTYMLQRFNEAFGEVDVLLVTGDHVAHDIAPDMDDITSEAQLSEAWDAVRTNLEATAQVIEKYFPNSLVLTDIGNNDGYHS